MFHLHVFKKGINLRVRRYRGEVGGRLLGKVWKEEGEGEQWYNFISIKHILFLRQSVCWDDKEWISFVYSLPLTPLTSHIVLLLKGVTLVVWAALVNNGALIKELQRASAPLVLYVHSLYRAYREKMPLINQRMHFHQKPILLPSRNVRDKFLSHPQCPHWLAIASKNKLKKWAWQVGIWIMTLITEINKWKNKTTL